MVSGSRGFERLPQVEPADSPSHGRHRGLNDYLYLVLCWAFLTIGYGKQYYFWGVPYCYSNPKTLP